MPKIVPIAVESLSRRGDTLLKYPARDHSEGAIRDRWAKCDHLWFEHSRVVGETFYVCDDPLFTSFQLRSCHRCGCVQARLWSVEGYPGEWAYMQHNRGASP